MEVLYVRMSAKLKDDLKTLAKSKEMLLSDYVRLVLLNHLEMDDILKTQKVTNPMMSVINPGLMEMWQFAAKTQD